MAEEVVNLLPDAPLVVIPGGGHTLNYSKPLLKRQNHLLLIRRS
ncbi:hypothetical protein [Umezakia ovalisporum]